MLEPGKAIRAKRVIPSKMITSDRDDDASLNLHLAAISLANCDFSCLSRCDSSRLRAPIPTCS